jgi:putative peptidoglycan lipid II flippase
MAESKTSRNLIWLTIASTSQIALQFLTQVVIAYQFGARADADSLAAALAIPVLLSSVLSGSLGYVLVPELVARFSSDERRRSGWQLASFFGALIAALAGVLSIVISLLAPLIVGWLYGELTEPQQATTSQLLGILSWQILYISLITWGSTVHHSRHSFIVPAFGGVLGMLATLALAWTKGPDGIEWIALASNVGSAISAAVSVLPLTPWMRAPRIERQTAVRLMWAFMPLLLGGLYLRIEPVVDRALASGLEEGSVARLHYAHRIAGALLTISTSGLAVIAFPQLADRLAGQGRTAFVEHLARAMRRLWLVTLPIAIGFSVFSVPVVADLLQRGRFTAEDSFAVGTLIVAFMGVFLGASSGELLARGYYTLSDTRTPTILGAAALTLGLIAKGLLLPLYGVWGIALGGSLYALLSAGSMAWLLRRRLGAGCFAGSTVTILQASAAALAACGASSLPYLFQFGRTWLAAPLGVATYALVLWMTGNEEMRLALSLLSARFRQQDSRP